MIHYSKVVILFMIVSCLAVENGLGRTPQMGWNPWNKYGCEINEVLMKQTADSLVDSGLAAAGYNYLNLDDCWQISRDPVTSRIIPDAQKFPSGMENLVSYVHSKGLKIGLYSDAGYQTCQKRPGSMGFEEIDALQYSEWDIDYLKYDNCNNDGRSPKDRYPPMAQALQRQTKKIFFSMCEWGEEQPHLWASQYANSWRTTGDISDNYGSFIKILHKQVGLENYSGPGGWNDPDMLEVGNGGMTNVEYQSHFALWALIKAPLIIGCDITAMSEETKFILMNKEVIAVNQDSLGKQGRLVHKNGHKEVWAVEVKDNNEGVVVVLFNKSLFATFIDVDLKVLGISESTVNVRDLINKTELGQVTGNISYKVHSHGIVMVKLTPHQQVQ